jgi:hypothetical protein
MRLLDQTPCRATIHGVRCVCLLCSRKGLLYSLAALITAWTVGTCMADVLQMSPNWVAAPSPLWEDDSAPGIRYASDRDGEEGGSQFEPYLQEIFLGFVIYPQEQGEVQLTWGYFDHVESNHDSQFLFELEYGITDQLQIGFSLPADFLPKESFDGVRHVGVELYWNFYNNLDTGRGYGAGFELGFPTDAPAGESRTYIYEPFVVAYQDFKTFAVNLSGGLEIEDALEPGEPTETRGELAAAAFGSVGKFTPMLELGVEIEPDQTTVRLAPGLYWSPCEKPVDFAVALPIGLNRDTPDFGVFLLAIVEFGGGY